MGGRAAEEIFLGEKEVTSGCEKDLEKATNIAYNLVMKFGFNEDLSLLSLTEKGIQGNRKNHGINTIFKYYHKGNIYILFKDRLVININLSLIKKFKSY